jgi:glycine betaine/proline transport system substrate-binding protein
MKSRTIVGGIALGAASMLTLTGCAAGEAETVENGDRADVTIAVFNGWDEGIAASELWKAVLTEQGYEVELAYADPAPVYAGIATGDYDLNLDSWLPVTHEDYVEQYGDDLVDLGSWNAGGRNMIAVNEDAPIDSLDELAGNADLFDNRIVGIEPGAGLTRLTKDEVIPEYGLEGMDFIESSSPAMFAELSAATAAGENIAVTLWSPHWAWEAFPIKVLEDPSGAYGAAEEIHIQARSDFEEEFPTLAGWLRGFEMDSDLLHSLENVMFNGEGAGDDDFSAVVAEWIADNREYVDSLTK